MRAVIPSAIPSMMPRAIPSAIGRGRGAPRGAVFRGREACVNGSVAATSFPRGPGVEPLIASVAGPDRRGWSAWR